MAIGIAWVDGAWVDASWVTGAWNQSVESGDTSGSGDLPKTIGCFTVATIGLQIGAIIAPTIPGLEYTLADNRMHYTILEGKLHFTLPDNRLHYIMDTNKIHYVMPENRLQFTLPEED